MEESDFEKLELSFDNGDSVYFLVGWSHKTTFAIEGVNKNMYNALNGVYSLDVCDLVYLHLKKEDLVDSKLMDEEEDPWNRLLTRDLNLVSIKGQDINVPYEQDSMYFNLCERITEDDDNTIRIRVEHSRR